MTRQPRVPLTVGVGLDILRDLRTRFGPQLSDTTQNVVLQFLLSCNLHYEINNQVDTTFELLWGGGGVWIATCSFCLSPAGTNDIY